MKIKKGFVVREVGGENVAVPVGERSKDFHGMIRLNSTGRFLWDFFRENHTEEEAVAALLAEYEVDEKTAAESVKKFAASLAENGFAE
ncbi:MAG: PqqD family protein [Candidatus Borkfalkiaceae bacterium]|nr:PqqD family protein [Christensenellaceae bacterium]